MMRRAGKRWCSVAFPSIALLSGGGPRAVVAQAPPRVFVLIVTGASGEPRFATMFHAQAMALRAAATTRLGVPDSMVTYLSEDPGRDPRAISGRSTREGVSQAIEAIASRAHPGDDVLILLLGHGSAQNDQSRFNLPGPDLTAADFSTLLGRLSAQHLAFVDASSSKW